MSFNNRQYILIEQEGALEQFAAENDQISWMGFDTEFVGEKRYTTLLCLIQVATENGFYLLDSLKLKQLDPFLRLLEKPKLTKITHAGANDYRLLNSQFGVLPKNLFDVQIAAGFVGYKYPISFQKIVEKEVGVRLRKGYTVSDWESRPINNRQVKYALDDVLFLHDIWQSLSKKLREMNRLEWVYEECKIFEKEAFYITDPHREALSTHLISNLSPKEQVFLIRLYEWRRSEAERKNYSKEMVLQNKLVAPIVRHIGSGRGALKNHRRIPDHVIRNYWDTFNQLFERPITVPERKVLARIPVKERENQQQDTIMELLNLLLRYKCQQSKMSPDLVINRSEFKKMKADLDYFDVQLEKGWRKEFLGAKMINWLKNRDRLEIEMQDDEFVFRLG